MKKNILILLLLTPLFFFGQEKEKIANYYFSQNIGFVEFNLQHEKGISCAWSLNRVINNYIEVGIKLNFAFGADSLKEGFHTKTKQLISGGINFQLNKNFGKHNLAIITTPTYNFLLRTYTSQEILINNRIVEEKGVIGFYRLGYEYSINYTYRFYNEHSIGL